MNCISQTAQFSVERYKKEEEDQTTLNDECLHNRKGDIAVIRKKEIHVCVMCLHKSDCEKEIRSRRFMVR